MDWNRRQKELEERLRNLTARDDDVHDDVREMMRRLEKVMETQEIQKVHFEEMREMMEMLLQRTSDGEVQKKLDELSEAVTKIKKHANEGNEEIDLMKKQQLLVLKGTQALEEVSRNFAGNLEHMLNSQVDFNLQITEIKKVGEKLSNFNGKDEELNSKMDKILEKLENYSDLEKEVLELNRKGEELDYKSVRILESLEKQEELKNNIDLLREMQKSQEFIVRLAGSHQELIETVDVIKDTVETTLGYSEMSSKDFEGVQTKILNMEINMSKICVNGRSLKQMIEKLNSLQEDLKGKADKISQSLTKKKQNTELMDFDLNEKSVGIGRFKMKTEESLMKLSTFFGIDSGPILRCCRWHCNRVLPKDLPLSEDGVSVQCPSCRYPNIVGILKEGHKWMYINDHVCVRYHFYQFPLSRKEGEKEKCPTCGKEGKLEDSNNWVSLRYDLKNYLWEMENKLRGIETALTLSSDNPLKCCQCKCIFGKNLPIREDGVSVKCPKCTIAGYNIVGKLKKNHKWMVAHDVSGKNGHYLQFPYNTKNGVEEECQVCGRMDTIYDANDVMAQPVSYYFFGK